MVLSKKIHLMLLQSAKLRRKPLKLWRKSTKNLLLIQTFFLKGTDFIPVSMEEIEEVQNKLNNQPWKGLNYLKLNEVFNDLVALKP